VCNLRVLGKCVCRARLVVGIATTKEVERRNVCENGRKEANDDGLNGKEVEDAQEIRVRDVCEKGEA